MALHKRLRGFAATLLIAGAATSVLAQEIDQRIRLNTVGFLPNSSKKASIAADVSSVRVRSAVDNSIVFRDVTLERVTNTDTQEELTIADFSGLTEPGRYYLYVNGVGDSPEFTVGNDVFREPYRALMLGMYLWRCGTRVSATYNNVTYATTAACHINDGSLLYITGVDEHKDGTGGWHDAGDYNKYVVNSGVTVGLMLKAWEHFRSAIEPIDLISVPRSGVLPPFLQEVKWNLDWVSKMQFSDGTVSHKLTTIDFGGNMMPEKETEPRYFVPWGTAATGAFAAMLAQASRIYRPYDAALADKWLDQARKSYDVLMASDTVMADQTGFTTGAYESGRDSDQRAWAAAELWETTGEERYLADANSLIQNMREIVRSSTEWANVQNLASMTYLHSEREGKDQELLETISGRTLNVANNLVNAANNHGYGRTFGAQYYWGANGAVASNAFVLYSAFLITREHKFLNAIQDAVSHLLGRNYYGRSYVTGVGHNPPVYPHCRRSASVNYSVTWPGYLIGGPHNSKSGGPSNIQCSRPAICWFDVQADYWTNEIAINWNSAMIYALSALVAAPDMPSSVRQASAPSRSAKTANARITRVAKARNGRLDVPPGASVYTLNGRLIAKRGINDARMPSISGNGVYIIKVENQLINNKK